MPTLGHITRLKTGEQDMLILAALTREMEFATDRKAGPQGTIPGLLGLLDVRCARAYFQASAGPPGLPSQ